MYSCTEQLPMKNAYETQLVQLEELIVQQRKQVQTLKNAFDDIEQRCALVQKDKFRFLDKKNRLLFLDDSRTRKLKKRENSITDISESTINCSRRKISITKRSN